MPTETFVNAIPSPVYRDGVAQTPCPDGRRATQTKVFIKRVKPVGWIPPTAYSFSRDSYERHNGRLHYSYHVNAGAEQYQSDWTGCVGVGTGTGLNSLSTLNNVYSPTGVPASWRDRAITKARLAMKDQDVNLGQAFAERNQTARLLGDTATTLAKTMRALRRFDWPGALRALGVSGRHKPRGLTVPQRWLELQYGWKPLLSDVYGATEALAKREVEAWRVTGRGSVKEDIDTGVVFTGSESSVGYGYGRCKGKKGVFVRIDALPENDLLKTMSSLGVTNPLLIGWELVPFSFVVDWALPVGDFLSSLDAMLGYGTPSCSISTFERTFISHTLASSSWTTQSGSATYYHTRIRSGHAHRERVSLVREALTTVPLPLLPRFKDPVSMKHMANGLSLLATAFARR